jgi:hypothetical protein
MAVDERGRLQLADAAKRAFGDDAGITLMELLPPVGWADVATKQDILHLERRFDALIGRMDSNDSRMGRLDARIDRLEGRMDRLEGRMDRLDARMDELTREIRAQTWKLMTLMMAVVGVVVAAVRV